MLEPYTEFPEAYTGDPRGTFKVAPEIFTPAVAGWVAAGYQVARCNLERQLMGRLLICIGDMYQVNTHCIGDACNRLALDAYEAAGPTEWAMTVKSVHEREARRHRIEHAQIVSRCFQPSAALPSCSRGRQGRQRDRTVGELQIFRDTSS